MKKIFNNINAAKDSLSQIRKDTTASMEIGYMDDNINKIYLKYNGVFKMVRVYYEGNILKVTSTDYSGFQIKFNESVISIINLNVVELNEDGYLCSFMGNVYEISKILVFPYGGAMFNAEYLNLNKDNFYYNENKWNESDDKFENIDKTLNNKRLRFPKRRKSGTSQSINGLYTHGNKFMLGKNKFVGNYNYNPPHKKYMTGATLTPKSKEIKLISDINRTKEV